MALRNVVHRRNHKERGQLGHRRKLGLLEKHKDYVERARDHHSKQDRLQRLQQKAALRNPDEFRFGMIRGAATQADPTKRGKRGGGSTHLTRRTGQDATPLANDLVAILKSQDLAFIRHAIRSEDKRLHALKERIRPGLGMLPAAWIDEREGRRAILVQHELLLPTKGKRASTSGPSSSSSSIAAGGKKTVWVDSLQDAQALAVASQNSLAKGKGKASVAHPAAAATKGAYSLDEEDDYVDLGDDDEDDDDGPPDASSTSAEKAMHLLVHELSSRQQRLDALHAARQKLEIVRNLMTTKGTSARKVSSNGSGGGKEEALRDAVAKGGRVTKNGLALPPPDDGDDDSEEEEEGPLGGGGGGKKKRKGTIWKWGRERKR